jgi:hypothetical protein
MEVNMAAEEADTRITASEIQSDTFAELRGRQSVRATFKLTNVCIEAISIVAGQLGIKQKSLFDHMFQDTASLRSLAKKLNQVRLKNADRIQKTYVLSRSALVCLEDIAKNYNASRDVLIEYSVQRLMPIIATQRKRYTQRKSIFKHIRKHFEEGRQLLQKAYSELGEEDPLTERLTAAMGGYESAFKQMAQLIRKTSDIEAFEPEALQPVQVEDAGAASMES